MAAFAKDLSSFLKILSVNGLRHYLRVLMVVAAIAVPLTSSAQEGANASPRLPPESAILDEPEIPLPPEILALPEAWHPRYRQLEALRADLRTELKAVLDKLPEPSPEDIVAAVEAFRRAQAPRLEMVQREEKALAAALKALPEPAALSDASTSRLRESFEREREATSARQKALYEALQQARDSQERARIMAEFDRVQESIKRELRERRSQAREAQP